MLFRRRLFKYIAQIIVLWFKFESNIVPNRCYNQSGTKPNLVAKIMATKFGFFL